MQKLTSKSKFAKMAGVNPSTVTRLCSTILKGAVAGKQIDAAHPDAVKYLQNRERVQIEPVAIGMDPLYEEAVKFCQKTGVFVVARLQREFKIGFGRGKSIIEVMKANGLVPKKGGDKITLTSEDAPAMTMDRAVAEKLGLVATKPRGQAAVKEAKKRQENEIIEIPDDIQAFADMTLRELIEKFGTDTRFVDWLSATQKIEAINEKRLKNAQTQGELVSRKLVRVGIIEPINACHIKLLTDGAKTIARRVTAMHSADRSLEDIEKFVAEQITSFIRPVKAKVARALKNA